MHCWKLLNNVLPWTPVTVLPPYPHHDSVSLLHCGPFHASCTSHFHPASSLWHAPTSMQCIPVGIEIHQYCSPSPVRLDSPSDNRVQPVCYKTSSWGSVDSWENSYANCRHIWDSWIGISRCSLPTICVSKTSAFKPYRLGPLNENVGSTLHTHICMQAHTRTVHTQSSVQTFKHHKIYTCSSVAFIAFH